MTSIPIPPPGFFQFPGKAPDGSGQEYFVIAKDGIIGHFRDARNRAKQLEGILVPGLLMQPSAIWADLRSAGKRDWMVFTGLPSGKFLQDTTIEVPCPPGQVFAVYIQGRKATGGQFVVDSWEWLEADHERSGYPIGHTTRYGRRLWTQE